MIHRKVEPNTYKKKKKYLKLCAVVLKLYCLGKSREYTNCNMFNLLHFKKKKLLNEIQLAIISTLFSKNYSGHKIILAQNMAGLQEISEFRYLHAERSKLKNSVL